MIRLAAQPVIEILHAELRTRISAFRARSGRVPGLAVILVGNDHASEIYTRNKREAALKLGMESQILRFPATATPEQVRAAVSSLNSDPTIDGILIQRPLPVSFRESEVVYWVSPEKDVDAFHPENAGRLSLGLPCLKPCTAIGILELLNYYKVELAGKTACVIGRSSIVGKPTATLLLQANATVIHCHSRTRNLAQLSAQADVLVVAIGKPEWITEDFIRPGAVVIDVGIHRNSEGKIVGDVQAQAVAARASMASPVPGGVGPMTIGLLLRNTVAAAELRDCLSTD